MAVTDSGAGADEGRPGRDGHAPRPDTAVVDRAASALRAYTDHGWSEASRRILHTVLTATRRSRPVRARGDEGDFHVSDQVVTTYLQVAIDGIDGVEATHIGLELDGDVLVALDLAIAVTYPDVIMPLAYAARRAAHTCVRDVLGDVEPALDGRRIHVLVHDVYPPADQAES